MDLMGLYASFMGSKNLLKNYPAQALSRRIQNTNLNDLWRMLFQLDIHKELMAVLKKKYLPKVDSGETISVDET